MVEHPSAGSVLALWRYPVKSMLGEQLQATYGGARGLLGDRAYAILDRATGFVASAKHPRKWHKLLACQAAYIAPPEPGAPLPAVAITLPDGSVVSSDESDIDRALSRVLGREVTLAAVPPPTPMREADRAPVDSEQPQETIREEPLGTAAPAGTFFDYATIHLLTTATLARLHELYPAGRFDVRRFRPNILLELRSPELGFPEQAWLGRTLQVGADLRLQLIDPSPRCVVTTMAQGNLPHDPGILRTLAVHASTPSATLAPGVLMPAVAGVYGNVVREGIVCCGAMAVLEEG
jgi:uncharacterized protein YcbX